MKERNAWGEFNGPQKIYVASSWRNHAQQGIVHMLRRIGHEVYDFKNPGPGDKGFAWSDIDPAWENWTPPQFVKSLQHPIAREGFEKDMNALESCDVCLLVLPCGRSAHLELGFAAGDGKTTAVLLSDGEPELMYAMLDALLVPADAMYDFFGEPKKITNREYGAPPLLKEREE